MREPYVDLARELATALETPGAGRPVDPEDLGTAVFEGR